MQPALAGLHFGISGQIIEVLGLGIKKQIRASACKELIPCSEDICCIFVQIFFYAPKIMRRYPGFVVLKRRA
jgi:hypothetical protein